jgi:N-acetylmuramoyl-L-alanine amidase
VRRLATASITFLLLFAASTAFGFEYRVKSGDTLSEIGERFGVSVQRLREVNGISGSTIQIGQRLEVPVGSVTHVVREGQALWQIALKYRVTAEQIMRANGLTSDLIHPNQRLTIPIDEAPAQPVQPTAQPVQPAPAAHHGAAHELTEGEIEILARIIKGECPPSTPWEGKVAVAAVVLNRLERQGYPKSVRGVAHQPLQFSCYNADVRDRLYHGPIPEWAWEAARAAASGEDPSRGATHYFNPFIVKPSWANGMTRTARIGTSQINTHVFYR